ncbi:MAG: CAP domain-containing protein [Sporomusa sp.]
MENYRYERQVARLVNSERRRVGLLSLQLNNDLSHVARIKSWDMYYNQYFSHQSPIYGSPFDMLAHFGIEFQIAAENIALGQMTPQEVMNAWMSSDIHRSNILYPYFTELGVGYFRYDGSPPYWTQLFIG